MTTKKYSVTGTGINNPFSNGSIDDVIDAIMTMDDGAVTVSIDDPE
jgi:hypothetical protein